MNIYLTIMVTALVLTQIVRVTQNAIQLRRQEKQIQKDFAWLKDNEVTETDFETQRAVFKLLLERLQWEKQRAAVYDFDAIEWKKDGEK